MVPNYMFGSYREITPTFLREKGIRYLLVDIDNTLAPYEQAEPDDDLRTWLASLRDDGVKLALVSNNNRERVERFNATLGLDAYPKSGKPGKKTLLLAMKNMGAELQTAVGTPLYPKIRQAPWLAGFHALLARRGRAEVREDGRRKCFFALIRRLRRHLPPQRGRLTKALPISKKVLPAFQTSIFRVKRKKSAQ